MSYIWQTMLLGRRRCAHMGTTTSPDYFDPAVRDLFLAQMAREQVFVDFVAPPDDHDDDGLQQAADQNAVLHAAAEAERARRESAAHRAKAAEEAAERAAAFASEARRRARDENLEAAAAADAAFAAATTPPPRDDEVSPRDGDENETEFLARERSPARFKARRPPAREDPGAERIERNMDKL